MPKCRKSRRKRIKAVFVRWSSVVSLRRRLTLEGAEEFSPRRRPWVRVPRKIVPEGRHQAEIGTRVRSLRAGLILRKQFIFAIRLRTGGSHRSDSTVHPTEKDIGLELYEMTTSTVNISANQVKELREKTGAPMMDCKQALTEAKGDLDQAVVLLRKRGVSVAAKKAARVTSEGSVASYIHAGGKIGVLVEVNCESDFVARTEDFKELVHDIAMHIAASDPKFIRKEDVTPEAYEREKDIYRTQAASTGKPPQVVEKIVEGKMGKFYEEVCLYEQPFIKDQTISIAQLVAAKIGKLGENISVRRFARFKVGEAGETIAVSKPEQKSE